MKIPRPNQSRDSQRKPQPAPGPLGIAKYSVLAQMAPAVWGSLWVARAEDGVEARRVVAVRRIGKRPPLDPSAQRRIALAGRAALKIRAAPLAAALDLVLPGSEVAIVSEYIEGEFLRSLQRRAGLGGHPIDVPVVLRLLVDTARALMTARDAFFAVTANEPMLHGAAHGGFTPDSLLVATYGEPVLYDVGVSGAALSRPELADHAEVIAYRAPEVLRSGVADERADVFALGVVAWELLANRPLFGSPRWARHHSDSESPPATEETARTRHRALEMPIPRLDAVVRAGASIPKDVASIVARALEKDPEDRYPTLDELTGELDALGEDRFAGHDDVASVVTALATTSLEARRLAVASVTLRPSVPAGAEEAAGRPTEPPRSMQSEGSVRLEELSTAPAALAALDVSEPKPPPLPKRRRGSIPDV